jgi:MFS family permease
LTEELEESKPGLFKRFPALQHREFRLIWMGQTISAVGSQMQITTIRWHIYTLTHSYVALGLIGLSRFLPVVILSLLGGAVADAKDRRRIMLTTQTALALGAAALAWLTEIGRTNAAIIYTVNALSASALAFDNPARQSILPNLVPAKHYPNAASINSVAFQTATITGPMLAGLLIARHNLAAIYWINAVSFLAVILALLRISPEKMKRPSTPEVPQSQVNITALKEGLHFVWKSPILVWTIALDFLATFFSSAEALLPVFARDVLHVGAEGYGALTSADAAGSILAGTIISVRRPIVRQGRTMLYAVAVYGLATVVFGLSHWFALSLLALAVMGAADTVSTILRQTVRQLVTPDRLRGRMTAVNMVFFMGGPQLGNLEAGLVANLIGAPLSVITGGLGCLIAVTWIAAKAPVLRRYKLTHSD